jgi:hypothetical protein
MDRIEVSHLGDQRYAVTIEEGGSESHHEVTATSAQVERLAAGRDPADLVEASIRFLLDREPKELIMSRFDLDTISRFFSEYETTIGEYL